MQCTQCEMLAVNGHACHEDGCPEAWRTERRECRWCGSSFQPDERRATCCSPCCRAAYNGHECRCIDCEALAEALS